MKELDRKQTIKPPKRIRVEMLVPYVIIWSLAVATACLVTGWNLRSDNLSQVKAEAHSLVEAAKAPVLKDQSQK
jgi:hypothetical protein